MFICLHLIGKRKKRLSTYGYWLFQVHWHPAEQWGGEDSGSAASPKGQMNVFYFLFLLTIRRVVVMSIEQFTLSAQPLCQHGATRRILWVSSSVSVDGLYAAAGKVIYSFFCSLLSTFFTHMHARTHTHTHTRAHIPTGCGFEQWLLAIQAVT